MKRVLVRSEALEKTFGEGELETPVLKGVSVEVAAGELVLLMGPSGSGKTTLISILAGLLRPTAGNVELCGSVISELHEAEVTRVRRRHLGFVFQSYNLFPALTALDNIAEVLKLKGLPAREARERATRALTDVGLGERLHHRPGELSGGQKQRVAIARALAGDPALIMGDEVTAALDTHTALHVLEILRGQVSAERGILLVTHDKRLEQFADRVIEIEDGQISRVLPGGAGTGAAA
ncbi:MAG: ABC transporter ATP-binding protein [Polyangiaceae bacterium]|nr:ABC transporter ATP-binding protein [Polyangiaceae bacterium]MCK6533680.1 ABC transporter ATP-binding protein [Polyangiaceae bacterium]